MQARVAHGTFVIERHYPATPERVFAAFAEPEKKRRWFAEGEGFIVDEYELNFRVGGRERARFRMAGNDQGAPIGNDTTYLDIIRNQRIVLAYSMSAGGQPFSASLTTIELLEKNGGTTLVHTEQGAFFEGSDGHEIREHGWRTLLEALANELAR